MVGTLGGVAGAFAVVAGLLFVDRIAAVRCAALTIDVNLVASMLLDQLDLIGLPLHRISVWWESV